MIFDYTRRIARLQALMLEEQVDVTLLSVGADLPYFTGYEASPSERLSVAVIPAVGEVSLFVPALEAPRVKGGQFHLRSWSEIEDPVALACSTVPEPARAAVGDHMWSVFLTRFQKEWGHSSWLPASVVTSRLRVIKDPAEIEALREAANAVDRAMKRIPSDVSFAGRTEREVMRSLADLTIAEGHESADFTIVASGPNGASPHHSPGDRVITAGDVVVCDFGGRRSRYYSDSTRTFVVGQPTPRQEEVHGVVLAAAQAGRAAVAPDIPCEQIDERAREIIDGAGLGDRFIHRTGHGIGMEVHEHPYLVAGNSDLLQSGMAFSVEPGAYIPGEFGIRIEDIVVCAEEGADVLNDSPRELAQVS